MTLSSLKTKYPKTYNLLLDYLKLPIKGINTNCPYWMNDLTNNIKGPYSGKGTPGQITRIIRKLNSKSNLTNNNINNVLENNKVGIDCSGLVFHLLNSLDKEKGGSGISNKFLRNNHLPSWRAAWRVNANCLTDKNYTKQVKTKDVQIGDILRLLKGKHVAMIVGVSNNEIDYVHASNYTKIKGVHLATIKITNWNKDLDEQLWLEKLENGEDYRTNTYYKSDGDSIRRLRWW